MADELRELKRKLKAEKDKAERDKIQRRIDRIQGESMRQRGPSRKRPPAPAPAPPPKRDRWAASEQLNRREDLEQTLDPDSLVPFPERLSSPAEPSPPGPRSLPRDVPVTALLDELSGGHDEARILAGEKKLDAMYDANAAITIREARKEKQEEIVDKARDDRMALREGHHQQNIRTLAERGAEQDPARAREIMNLESERLGLPRLRTSEERKIAHGTYGPSDPTGLEGRMLGLAPDEPEPRRLTARERSQLGQGVAGEDLIDHAIATGQFDSSNLGFATPGTENERGVRYEEGRDIPGATRVMGPRQARLEDLLSEAEDMDFTGDTAGAASARARVEGIRAEQAADRDRQRLTTRRSRNARDLTDVLAMRERSRPGGVDVSSDEQSMVEGMTPAQRDRLTLKRSRARGLGQRDESRREGHRQAWNAEALRRDPSLLDTMGGKPMSEYQREQVGLQKDRLAGERDDRRGDEAWRKIQYQESVRKEADAKLRGDKAEADRERKWQFDLEKMAEERERYRTTTDTATTRYREGKEESKLEREAREKKEQRQEQIGLEQTIIADNEATPDQKQKARGRLSRLVNRKPLLDTVAPDPSAPGPGPAGPSPATPTAAEVPEGYEDDRGYEQQEAARLIDRLPQGKSPQRDRHNLVLRLRKNPADEQQMLRDLYSIKWKNTFTGSNSGTWASWAEKEYIGYTVDELEEFYKMETPPGDDPGDWHDYSGRQDILRGRLYVLPESQRDGTATFVPRSKAKRANMSENDPTWTQGLRLYPEREGEYRGLTDRERDGLN